MAARTKAAGSITPFTTTSTTTRISLDTDFSYGRALAQTAGTMVMRMADADMLPFQFSRSGGHGAYVRDAAEDAG